MTVLGPDGRPANGPRVTLDDSTVTVTHGDESYSADPEVVLMEMARAQINGWSHKQIIAHYQLVGQAASPFVLERALKTGRDLLARAVAEGREPADARITDPVDYAKERYDDDV